MELFIFDKNLNFKGILDTFTSLQWIKKYYKYGEFELHCKLTPENINLLQRENIVWKKDDDEAGFIDYRQLIQDENGDENLIVKGPFLTKYLERRIIWGQQTLQTTAESAMRVLIDKQCITPEDNNRIIPGLILGEIKNYSKTVDYQISYANLLGEIENISNISDLGYKIIFDIQNKKLIFDVYNGLDRTIDQSINSHAIFSKEFENVLEQEFVDSLNNYKSLALVGGIGEGIERKLVSVGNTSGLDRFEMFVDAKDLSNIDENNNPISDTDYNLLLKERGNTKLAECTDIKTFDSKINVNSNLIYKVDFDLGDIVTCTSKKWGITINTRITEVTEVYEESGPQINIIFGNNIPTLLDKIKQKLK